MAQPEWERARSADAQRVWEAVLCPLAAELHEGAGTLSSEVVGAIREQMPELFPDEEAFEENRAATEANLRAFADVVTAGADPAALELPVATIAYARDGAQRGIPLPLLLRSYRLGQAAVWQGLLTELAARAQDAAALATATELASAWMFAFVDVASTLSEQIYMAERERWMRSASAVRAETIEGLLDGGQRDPGVAAARLAYELDRHHVGVLAWLDSADERSDPISSLEAAIAGVATSVGTASTLVHPLGLLSAAAWLGAPEAFEPAALAAAAFDGTAAPSVRVALGEPGAGIAGFRRTHTEAGHARRVATLAGRRPGTVTRFGSVALTALATADVDEARAFVAGALGDLAGEDDVSLRLAATVRTYLDENASRSRAAKRLGIHENTVSYRVRQAEEILGRSVEDDALDLRVALALVNVVRLRS